ncbi:Uncharacterized protein TCM_008192 [Theobroma cacao]|uniref:Protein E6-like n=1 Tax=Theobroma cacao TaxID=3641 RepID=A0A061EB41_THECC|nr:Uncharacterized protein TCM_008192 [Theobroma cacao]
MASFAKRFTFFFLLMLSSYVQIQARESKFFSKIFHLGARISPDEVPTPTPAPAPAPEPANSESQDPYYGLYGQGSGMFPPAKDPVSTTHTPTTATTFENDLLAEELEDEKFETGYEKNSYNNNGYTTRNYNYNNGYTTSNHNNNGYTTSNYNNNGYSSSYKTNGYASNYNNNGYETERQGMSDTRSVEGGKYYYDVENVNYYPEGYESGKETSKNEGYYGNTENSNEFNSMGEFQESQEEYVP